MSALNLRRLLGITINAAMRMNKLQHVMKSADDSMTLEGLVEVDDVYWGGKSKGGKHGRGAPGKTPFLAAVTRNEKGHPIQILKTLFILKYCDDYQFMQAIEKQLNPHGEFYFSDDLVVDSMGLGLPQNLVLELD